MTFDDVMRKQLQEIASQRELARKHFPEQFRSRTPLDKILLESPALSPRTILGIDASPFQRLVDDFYKANPLAKFADEMNRRFDPLHDILDQWNRANPVAALAESVRRDNVLRNDVLNKLLPQGIAFGYQQFLNIVDTYQRDISKQLESLRDPLRDSIRALHDSITAAVPRSILEEFQRNIAEIGRITQVVVTNKTATVLKQRRWAGLQYHFTVSDFQQLLRTRQRKGLKAVDEFVCRRFRKDRYRLLTRMSRKWSKMPYLTQNRGAFKDALKAHRDGRYRVSITMLLPLIDGLAREIVIACKGKTRKIIVADEAVEILEERHGDIWTDGLKLVVEQVVFARCDPRKSVKPRLSLNRHAILHGIASPRYASEANSLRIILVLDVFARLLQGISRPTKP